MSPKILKGLKKTVTNVLESDPEILNGQKIVFSDNCGKEDVKVFKEFQNCQKNTVKVLIYPNKYSNDQIHMIISSNFYYVDYCSEKIRETIKKTFGKST